MYLSGWLVTVWPGFDGECWLWGGWGAGPLLSLVPTAASGWCNRPRGLFVESSWCCCCCFLCNWNSRELVTGSCGGCGGGWFFGGGGGGARCPPFLVLLGLWSAGHAPPPPPPLPPRMQWLGEPLLGHKGVNSIELEEEAMHTSNACTSEWPITYYSQNEN